MNSLANHFKQILSTLTHCPEDKRLESLLANFASKVATQGQTLTNSSKAETKQLEAQVEKLQQIFRAANAVVQGIDTVLAIPAN